MFSWLIKCFLNCSVSLAESIFKFSIYFAAFCDTFSTSSSTYQLKKWALSALSFAISFTSLLSLITSTSMSSFIYPTSSVIPLNMFWSICFLSSSALSRASVSSLIISVIRSLTVSCCLLKESMSDRRESACLDCSMRIWTSSWVRVSSSYLTQELIVLIYASRLF